MSRAEVKPPPEVWRINGLEVKPFMKIKEACAVTGLSQIYLRRGVRDGTIPHIVSGPKNNGKGTGTYYINMPALLKQLGVPLQGGDLPGLG